VKVATPLEAVTVSPAVNPLVPVSVIRVTLALVMTRLLYWSVISALNAVQAVPAVWASRAEPTRLIWRHWPR